MSFCHAREHSKEPHQPPAAPRGALRRWLPRIVRAAACDDGRRRSRTDARARQKSVRAHQARADCARAKLQLV
eukprot:6209367-Pleurochrysis_carterae.AAC.2